MPHRRSNRNAHGEVDGCAHCEYILMAPHGEALGRDNEAYERDETAGCCKSEIC